MSSLTKVAKGIAYGDVSNTAIRNILTELSKQLYGKFTEQDCDDTDDFFKWECPYTGEKLTKENSVMDHIVPQNKDCCGLNVKGNLARVSKIANSAKGSQDFEEFIHNNTSVISADKKTREERIQKIKQWQEKCGYDPALIRDKIKDLLSKWYNEIREQQEERVKEAIEHTRLQSER